MLAPRDIAYPLRKIAAEYDDFTANRRDVVAIDPVARSVTTSTGETFTGDYLVLAAGSQPNFFGTPGAEHAFPLYSLDDAERLRTRIIQAFEEADRDRGAGGRRRDQLRDRRRRSDRRRGRRRPVRDDRDDDGPRVPRARRQGRRCTSSITAMRCSRCSPTRGISTPPTSSGRTASTCSWAWRDRDRPGSRDAVRRPSDQNPPRRSGAAASRPHPSPGPAACRRAAADGSTCSRTSRSPAFPASSPSATSPTSRTRTARPIRSSGRSRCRAAGRRRRRSLRTSRARRPKPFHYLDKGTMAMIGRGAAIAQVPPGRRAPREARLRGLARRPCRPHDRRQQPGRRVQELGRGLLRQGTGAAGARPERRAADDVGRRRRGGQPRPQPAGDGG